MAVRCLGLALAVAFAAGTAAGPASGDVTTTTTTEPGVTSTDPLATTPATTVTETTTTETAVTTETTTGATTSAPTTTATAPPPTTTSSHRAAGPLVARSLGRRCTFGAVAILRPGRAALVLGPLAAAGAHGLGADRLVYPRAGTLVRATGISLDAYGCDRGRSTTEWVSLFGGVVIAHGVMLTVRPGSAVRVRTALVTVGGAPLSASRRGATPLGDWGSLQPGTGGRLTSALSIRLVHAHDGLSAGTIVLVSFAALPEARKRSVAHRPLHVTPALGLPRYVFPVAGASAFGDTYGAFRSDVSGGWHHGDDIFAPLGTPVVAVADGTLNRVGWEAVGGWRLWVRDGIGNEFYYAHLSGYTAVALHSRRVRAGEVLGFVGDTGDALATPPHLHFEIHPRPLLHLAYDGAVDPTGYLRRWPRLDHVVAPRPVEPPLPPGSVRREVRRVFRELLAARHLLPHASARSESASAPLLGAAGDPRAVPVRQSAAVATHPSSLPPLLFALLCATGALALFAASTVLAGYRSRALRGEARALFGRVRRRLVSRRLRT
jgi:hypothetical protein